VKVSSRLVFWSQ